MLIKLENTEKIAKILYNRLKIRKILRINKIIKVEYKIN